jgi:hypothetical protein
MRYVKMLGLAALAATALVAVMAASASANARVCSTTNGNPVGANCEAGHGKIYNGPIGVSLTPGTGGVDLSGAITVNCGTSNVSGTFTNGATGTGQITSWTFSGCSSILGSCTASTTASAANPWPVTWTTDGEVGSTRGWLDLSNATGQFTCAGVTCKYDKPVSNNEITLDGSDVAGGARLTIDMHWTLEPGQPSPCGHVGSPFTLEGTYTVISPSTLMVE